MEVKGFARYSFSLPTNYPVGGFPDSVARADLTGNGILDLVVINEGDQTLTVLLGNGDGTFQNAHTHATGSEPNAIAVGDFTTDGLPDLVVANSGSDTVSVFLNVLLSVRRDSFHALVMEQSPCEARQAARGCRSADSITERSLAF